MLIIEHCAWIVVKVYAAGLDLQLRSTRVSLKLFVLSTKLASETRPSAHASRANASVPWLFPAGPYMRTCALS